MYIRLEIMACGFQCNAKSLLWTRDPAHGLAYSGRRWLSSLTTRASWYSQWPPALRSAARNNNRKPGAHCRQSAKASRRQLWLPVKSNPLSVPSALRVQAAILGVLHEECLAGCVRWCATRHAQRSQWIRTCTESARDSIHKQPGNQCSDCQAPVPITSSEEEWQLCHRQAGFVAVTWLAAGVHRREPGQDTEQSWNVSARFQPDPATASLVIARTARLSVAAMVARPADGPGLEPADAASAVPCDSHRTLLTQVAKSTSSKIAGRVVSPSTMESCVCTE